MSKFLKKTVFRAAECNKHTWDECGSSFVSLLDFIRSVDSLATGDGERFTGTCLVLWVTGSWGTTLATGLSTF